MNQREADIIAVAEMAVSASHEAGELRMKVSHARVRLVAFCDALLKSGLTAEAYFARAILETLE